MMKPDNLMEHPEGGRFQEVYRSEKNVTTEQKTQRAALTHIYFSLKQGEHSRFHKVKSDEVWNLYQGDGLMLHLWDEATELLQTVELSASNNTFCHVIPANIWQAAAPTGQEVLVGCSVAPGFEFEDFELIDPTSKTAIALLNKHASLERFVK